MNSNSRCMRRTYGIFGPASIAAGTRLVCLPPVGHIRQRCFEALGVAVMSAALGCAGAWAAAADSGDSAQAKAKLSVVRARIAELTKHVGDELKQRDGLSARLREAELVITAQRRRLDTLRAEQAAAERRR